MITTFSGPEFHHRIKRTEDILQKVVASRDQLASQHTTWAANGDARLAALNRCVNILTSLLLSFAFIEQCLSNKAWWDANVQGTLSDRQVQLSEYDQFIKIGFTQALFSVIDSHFRAFLSAIDPTACNGGRGPFENIRAALFKRISNTSDQDRELLELFRLVRNTIHNNGAYKPDTPRSSTLSYRGEVYEFKDGHHITFADWEVVLQIAEDVCDLFRRLVLTPTIEAVSTTIPG